jgi:hypothetical protein
VTGVPWNKGKKLPPLFPERRKKLSEAMKGRKFSPESIAKMCIAQSGKYVSPETCAKISEAARRRPRRSTEDCAKMSERMKGEGNPMYGKKRHHTLETRKKMSESKKGEKNPGWIDGRGRRKYCFKFDHVFKDNQREKFGYVCFECGKPEPTGCFYKHHGPHHIDYNKGAICNGKEWGFVLLCRSCNVKANTNRYYWFNKYISYWIEPPLMCGNI